MNGHAQSYSMGSDRVQRIGSTLTVISRIGMDDWQVREYRRVAVWVDGQRYVVGGRAPGGRGAVRYRLEPWPDDPSEVPGAEVFYDESYVLERDRRHILEQRKVIFSRLLLPFHPLLGFLWFPAKERLQLSLGIDPGRVTAQGLFLQYLAILGLFTVGLIARHAPLGLSSGRLWGLIAVLLPDAVMRWSLLSDGFPAGFGEWLLRRKRP